MASPIHPELQFDYPLLSTSVLEDVDNYWTSFSQQHKLLLEVFDKVQTFYSTTSKELMCLVDESKKELGQVTKGSPNISLIMFLESYLSKMLAQATLLQEHQSSLQENVVEPLRNCVDQGESLFKTCIKHARSFSESTEKETTCAQASYRKYKDGAAKSKPLKTIEKSLVSLNDLYHSYVLQWSAVNSSRCVLHTHVLPNLTSVAEAILKEINTKYRNHMGTFFTHQDTFWRNMITSDKVIQIDFENSFDVLADFIKGLKSSSLGHPEINPNSAKIEDPVFLLNEGTRQNLQQKLTSLQNEEKQLIKQISALEEMEEYEVHPQLQSSRNENKYYLCSGDACSIYLLDIYKKEAELNVVLEQLKLFTPSVLRFLGSAPNNLIGNNESTGDPPSKENNNSNVICESKKFVERKKVKASAPCESHEFVEGKRVRASVPCSECNKLITILSKGYTCKICKTSVHKKCSSRASIYKDQAESLIDLLEYPESRETQHEIDTIILNGMEWINTVGNDLPSYDEAMSNDIHGTHPAQPDPYAMSSDNFFTVSKYDSFSASISSSSLSTVGNNLPSYDDVMSNDIQRTHPAQPEPYAMSADNFSTVSKYDSFSTSISSPVLNTARNYIPSDDLMSNDIHHTHPAQPDPYAISSDNFSTVSSHDSLSASISSSALSTAGNNLCSDDLMSNNASSVQSAKSDSCAMGLNSSHADDVFDIPRISHTNSPVSSLENYLPRDNLNEAEPCYATINILPTAPPLSPVSSVASSGPWQQTNGTGTYQVVSSLPYNIPASATFAETSMESFDVLAMTENLYDDVTPSMKDANIRKKASPYIYLVALYDFTGEDESYLSFCAGEKLRLTEKYNDGWWSGTLLTSGLKKTEGYFPLEYVLQIDRDDCVMKALYDFAGEGEDELSVRENDIVVLMQHHGHDERWCMVRSPEGQGLVPTSFMTILDM